MRAKMCKKDFKLYDSNACYNKNPPGCQKGLQASTNWTQDEKGY